MTVHLVVERVEKELRQRDDRRIEEGHDARGLDDT